MNRPDKSWDELSQYEQECGGIPSSKDTVLQDHASAIESWVENHVGVNEHSENQSTHTKCLLNRTLYDWAAFDIEKRTKHDATISSGYAIMAVQKHKYRSKQPRVTKKINLGFRAYEFDPSTGRQKIVSPDREKEFFNKRK